ncbi:MAG TPA: hypothetical protein VMU84_05990 [Thermoanaerobaculia bacterium]|nr:hypothetical protein [Thermoanaerobaculia bacterium]
MNEIQKYWTFFIFALIGGILALLAVIFTWTGDHQFNVMAFGGFVLMVVVAVVTFRKARKLAARDVRRKRALKQKMRAQREG